MTVYDSYLDGLTEALEKLSPTAHRKILATLRDTSQPIVSQTWASTFGVNKNEKKKPKVCGCLMMDGYLKEHPESWEFAWSEPAFTEPHWRVEENDQEWADLLVDYYEMEVMIGDWYRARERIKRVAEKFDQFCRGHVELTYYKNQQTFLNAKGRRLLINIIEKIIKDNNNTLDTFRSVVH